MPVIVLHGGAGRGTKNLAQKCASIKKACEIGYAKMKSGLTAIDAVEAAVNAMEDDPCFNAGFGSALTTLGQVENDALIIDGKTMNAGAVGNLKHIKNPISAARIVLEKSHHCLLVSEGAENFLQSNGMKLISAESLISESSREMLSLIPDYETQIKVIASKTNGHSNDANGFDHNHNDLVANFEKDHDTVGAVALDDYGNLATATSTGGLTGKLPGRIGDSPLIGSGGWADNENLAISTTGHGESIMKMCLARHIVSLYEFNHDLNLSLKPSLEIMKERFGGDAGVITLNAKGEIGIEMTSKAMPWAYIKDDCNVVGGSTSFYLS